MFICSNLMIYNTVVFICIYTEIKINYTCFVVISPPAVGTYTSLYSGTTRITFGFGLACTRKVPCHFSHTPTLHQIFKSIFLQFYNPIETIDLYHIHYLSDYFRFSLKFWLTSLFSNHTQSSSGLVLRDPFWWSSGDHN